jgi:pimeloyl-ACP methyl ester carboxylesterase
MTDMAHEPCRSTMSAPHSHAVWNAPDREAAIAAATLAHGSDGSRLAEMAAVLPPSDLALFTDPGWVATARAEMPAMFTFGLEGYTDDRLADGDGWTAFDPSTITCPVTVLHGLLDPIVDVAHARHTAAIVPGAKLQVFDVLGHFSIVEEVIPTVVDLLEH